MSTAVSFVCVEHKDPSRVAAGLKASLHNPHVSDEAKRHAQERLESMGSVQHGKAQHETLGTHHVGASHHQVEDNRVLGTWAALGHLRFNRHWYTYGVLQEDTRPLYTVSDRTPHPQQ